MKDTEFARVKCVEVWCCGIAADFEISHTPIEVYPSEASCRENCACTSEPECAPRKLTVNFGTNMMPASKS
jgi:hypothetical protein